MSAPAEPQPQVPEMAIVARPPRLPVAEWLLASGVVDVLIFWMAAGLFHFERGDTLTVLIGTLCWAVVSGQLGVLAIMAVYLTSSWPARTIVTTASGLFLLSIPLLAQVRDNLALVALLPISLFVLLALQVPLRLHRWLTGSRLRGAGGPRESLGRSQFSLGQLIGVTTLVAVLAALARYTPPDMWDFYLMVPVAVFFSAGVVLPCAHFGLASRIARLSMADAAVTGLAVASVAIFGWVALDTFVAPVLLLFPVGSAVVILVSLLLVRRAGYALESEADRRLSALRDKNRVEPPTDWAWLADQKQDDGSSGGEGSESSDGESSSDGGILGGDASGSTQSSGE